QAPLMRGGQGFIDRQHAQLVAVVRDHAHRTDTNLPIDPRARCFAVVVYWRQVYSSSDGVKKGPGCGSVEAAICCQPSACLLMADGRWQMAQTNPRALS